MGSLTISDDAEWLDRLTGALTECASSSITLNEKSISTTNRVPFDSRSAPRIRYEWLDTRSWSKGPWIGQCKHNQSE